MARIISLIVLVVLVLLFGILFIQVMAGFFVPLFLAVLLAVLFRPLHRWLTVRLNHRVRVAAAITTLSVLIIVFTPIVLVTLRTVAEAHALVSNEHLLRLDPELLRDFVRNVNDRTGLSLDEVEIQKTVVEWGQRTVGSLAIRTPQFLGGLVLGLAIMTIALYYFLADGEQMVVSVGRLLPLELAHQESLLDR